MIRNNSKIVLLLTTLLIAGTASAQTKSNQTAIPANPPAAGPGPEGPGLDSPGLDGPRPEGPEQSGRPGRAGRPGRPGRPAGPVADRLTALTTLSGTVGQWTGNDDYMLDGFTLTGGSAGTTTVRFPAHLGQQIQKAVKPGASVKVTGFSEARPDGGTQFRLTSLTSGSTTVIDSPPLRSDREPAQPEAVTITGKIADYRLDRQGKVNGLIMSDKTIVRIPPHVAYQLTNLATKGSTITVQGFNRPVREGQVQLERVNILQASVLTINGQQYLVR